MQNRSAEVDMFAPSLFLFVVIGGFLTLGAVAVFARWRNARAPRTKLPMMTIHDAAAEFLRQKRIAVTGVSRDGKSHGANVVYQRLRERGYRVFAVNPNAKEVEGDAAFPDL